MVGDQDRNIIIIYLLWIDWVVVERGFLDNTCCIRAIFFMILDYMIIEDNRSLLGVDSDAGSRLLLVVAKLLNNSA